MKKLENFLEYKFVKLLLDDVSEEYREYVHDYIIRNIDIDSYSFSSKKRSVECLIDINRYSGSDTLIEQYELYKSTKSSKGKLKIRYGESRVETYNTTMKSRTPGKVVSRFTVEYWVERGFSVEEAKLRISDIQKENVSKRDKSTYENFSLKTPISIDYWVNMGYSEEEAETLRIPYLQKSKRDLESYILLYGDELGTTLYNTRIEKYKNSMTKKIEDGGGIWGRVSKSSLKFFIPLYKFCRRLGLRRKDIFVGVSGSREFFIRDNSLDTNGGYFYDFTIPKLNVIIEYNGVYWHPRDRETWKNKKIDYDTAKFQDEYKIGLAEKRGFDCHIVWEDDDLNHKFDEIKNIIREKYGK